MLDLCSIVVVLNEWNAFGKYEYYFGTASSNWNGAKGHCEGMPQSRLASITTEAEHVFAITVVEQTEYVKPDI